MPRVFHNGVWYDSKFEKELATGVLRDVQYHKGELTYTVIEHKKYEPDFLVDKGRRKVYIEAKGRFRDRHEANKYLHIRDSLPINYELVFLFMNPNTPMFGSKKRKDGTRFSVSEWAEKNDFRWFTEGTIESIL